MMKATFNKLIKLVILFLLFHSAFTQDVAKYYGGSYDGHGSGISFSDIFFEFFNVAKYYGGSYDGVAYSTSASDISLPVMLVSFNAVAINDHVDLTWVTESELNIMGFHVYRSLTENDSFQLITSELINGAGNSSSAHEYHFTDWNVIKSITYWYKIACLSSSGIESTLGPISVTLDITMPNQFSLMQNFPNPFNSTTEIRYKLPEASYISLSIYDVIGRKVEVLVDSKIDAGEWSIKWFPRNKNSEIYFIKMQTENFTKIRKMVYIK